MEPNQHQQLIEKYKAKIRQEFGAHAVQETKVTSKEYTEFKEELYPTHLSLYEKACNFSERILKLTPNPQKAVQVQKNVDVAHLNVTPAGVLSFSIIGALAVMVTGSILALAIPLILGLQPKLFFIFFFLTAGALLIPALQQFPDFTANTWRMKSSNQMIQSIFYLVTYMRHTSNLERAIGFAADHLEPPLSLDFRKILWDVETGRYSTIRESADAFLEFWKDWNKEFIESFHLIESSLFESSEERRLTLLDKSLDVILTGTYENMLHYAHNLKSPMTMLHMLGVILPILGLVILPLIVSFLGSGSNPFTTVIYISLIYNITLPISVYYLGQTILSKRPAGYGTTDIGEKPGLQKFRNVNIPLTKNITISVNPLYFSIIVFAVLFIIGISPILFHTANADFEIQTSDGGIKFLDYICPICDSLNPGPAGSCGINCNLESKIGPYGLGAALLSLIVTASIGLSLGLFYSLRSKNVIAIRDRTRALEDEFSSALFQLGNRLGDGLPAEIALAKVAATMQGTTSGDFFNITEKNITKLGMGLEQALFDPKVGSITSFPSNVIESSMKVLAESIKKGPRIAAQALLSMSRYIKEIHRVEERLKDLMADIISSMKSQIKFLTPAIAGIVIGITSMVSTILTKLSAKLSEFSAGTNQASSFSGLLEIFGIGVPTYYFQIIVGIYVVQIGFILITLTSGIENGADPLGRRFSLGKDLVRSTLLYCFIAGIVMVMFNLFASQIISRTL
ncbi:MAG: hypothetical protein Q8R37_05720 [Nanoarchaeota archaeon]|nr:hypothetical protein [Nanoarchaeota archaeon]